MKHVRSWTRRAEAVAAIEPSWFLRRELRRTDLDGSQVDAARRERR